MTITTAELSSTLRNVFSSLMARFIFNYTKKALRMPSFVCLNFISKVTQKNCKIIFIRNNITESTQRSSAPLLILL